MAQAPKKPTVKVDHKELMRRDVMVGVDQLLAWLQQVKDDKIPISIAAAVMKLLDAHKKEILDKAYEGATAVFTPMRDKVKDLLLGLVSQSGEVTPENAAEKAANFFLEMMGFGLAAHGASLGLEALYPLKHLGVSQPIAFMADLAAFGPIASATWGRAVGDGVGRPMSYKINQLTRSRLLGEGDAEVARAKRHIDDNELRQLLAYHGYNEHYIDVIVAGGFHSPSLREVILASEDTNVTESNVRDWLRGATYKDEDVDIFVRVAMERATRGARQAFLSSVGNLYEAGLIDDARWSDLVDNLNLRPEAKVFLSLGEGMNLQRGLAEDHRREVEAGYVNDTWSQAEVQLALSALGYTEMFITAAIARLDTKKQVKAFTKEQQQSEAEIRKVQGLILSDLREQFQSGEIGEPSLFAQLVTTGFAPNFAAAVVALEATKFKVKTAGGKSAAVNKLAAKIVAEKRDNLIAAFRKELIGEEELTANLLQLGLSTQLVSELVDGELLRAFRPPAAPKPTTAVGK